MPQGSTFTTRPQLAGTFGMVASTHWLASAAGMAVLEKGGNAFDAAVAAGLVLQVVEPHLNGPGGEVPVIGYDAGQRRGLRAGRPGRPRRRPPPWRRSGRSGLDLVPGSGLLRRLRPRRVRDLDAAARRARPAPAARGDASTRSATRGTATRWCPAISAGIASVADAFREHWPSSAEIYLAGGVPAPGHPLRQPRPRRRPTSGCWTRRRRRARAGRPRSRRPAAPSTRGSWPRRSGLPGARRGDGRHRANGTGPCSTAGDLAAWRASAEPPVTAEYEGLTVCKTGPWGQGPVFLQQLALLAGLRPRRHGAGQRGLHPHRRGVRQAGLRRPGSLVRRSPVRRRAAGRRCCRRATRRSAAGWSARPRRRTCARAARAAPSPGCRATRPVRRPRWR